MEVSKKELKDFNSTYSEATDTFSLFSLMDILPEKW